MMGVFYPHQAMKKCSLCGDDKEDAEFSKDSSKKSGLSSRCRVCKNSKRSEYRISTSEHNSDYMLEWRYNISRERYIKILHSQNGVCAVCKLIPKKFCVDHDHTCCPGKKSCGKCIRGLLCSNCNTAIGLLKENVNTLFEAINYINGD